jgi:flagellar biosynthesis component FlhA
MIKDEYTDFLVIDPVTDITHVNRRVVSGGDEAFYIKEVDALTEQLNKQYPNYLVYTFIGEW